MRGLLDKSVLIGCDERLEDGTPCPRLMIAPSQPAEAAERLLVLHGWGTQGAGFEARHACPVHAAKPCDMCGLARATTPCTLVFCGTVFEYDLCAPCIAGDERVEVRPW